MDREVRRAEAKPLLTSLSQHPKIFIDEYFLFFSARGVVGGVCSGREEELKEKE
jgi:hypothetical protein